jgi:hypothetical protein
MPEVRQRVRYCSYLLAVVAATSCLIGTVYFLSSEPMPYHLAAIGMSFEEIRGVNPNLALFLARTVNTLGVFQVGIGILAIGIALGAFRRAEPWAWFTLVPALSIVLARITLATFRVDAPVKWVALLLLFLSLTAILVPVKDFFGSR